jgi:hypothetical protein
MKNKKTLSMLVLGLLLGGGAIGAMQVSANNAKLATADTTDQVQQETVSDKTTSNTINTSTDEKLEGTENKDDEKNGIEEKDGIDHQFEGDEGNHQD